MKLSERFEAMAQLAREQEAGKQLQLRDKTISEAWESSVMTAGNIASPENWRVKPEPAVIYCNEYSDGHGMRWWGNAYSEKDKCGDSCTFRTAVKFREVTDED